MDKKNEIKGGKKPSKTVELSKNKDQIVLNPKLEPVNNLNERVVDLAQRRRRASLMRRVHAKLERRKEITGQRLHTPQQITQSAERIAKNILRKRFAGARGAEYQVLAPSDKVQVDKIVDKKAQLIKTMALKMVPRLRSADVRRLQAKRSGQAVKGLQSYMGARPMMSGDELQLDDLVKLFEQVDSKVLKVLDEKANKHGVPSNVLEAVFLRGLYENGEQGAFDRVNAFLALGKNALEEDSDVLQVAAEAVWDQPNPNKGKSKKMSPADKAEAKRRAKAAGRPYPNLVDNMAAMKEAMDDEGGMAQGELKAIALKASALAKKMKKNKQLDGWVQSKITKADDYIGSVHDYLMNNKQEVDESEIEQDTSDVKVVIDRFGKERKVRAHKRMFNVESLSFVEYSMMDEEEKKTLNKPFLTPDGPKKRSVYVKDPSTGNVKKVNFGDPNMRIKKSDPERRKSFRARHNCDDPGPKTKARYWSCRAW